MARPYDLVVIGTGTTAMTAAMRLRAAGWSVAVIDFRPFGGTCALRGCDPKKMLVGVATARIRPAPRTLGTWSECRQSLLCTETGRGVAA